MAALRVGTGAESLVKLQKPACYQNIDSRVLHIRLLFYRHCVVHALGIQQRCVVHTLTRKKKKSQTLLHPPLSYCEEKLPRFETLTTWAASVIADLQVPAQSP